MRGRENNALIILRLSEQERGVKVFADNGVRVLSQAEVDAL